jgi:RNase P subunit RPR2
MKRPMCDKCGTNMISMCARLGNGINDTRKTSLKSYKRIGYMCRTCNHMIRTPMPPAFYEARIN